jgi:hypothetical protein
VSDLHAIAVVRRLLLELGCVLAPDETHPHLGRLALWIAQPRLDLNGQTPLKTLGHDGGEERVRQCLARVLAGRQATSGTP